MSHDAFTQVELTDLDAREQREWIDEALGRITWPSPSAPAVCVLDTGVNRGHPLISPILDASDNQSVLADLDGSDGHGGHGHGTPMRITNYAVVAGSSSAIRRPF